MAACPALFDRTMDTILEKPQSLCEYAGKVVLVVNTAVGALGEGAASLVGATLLNLLGLIVEEQVALNDVAIHKAGVARVVRIRLSVDGEELGPYSADGVVIASPTGSTAYSLSAGGPLVAPGVEAMIVTPVCAHTLAVRPVVVPPEATICAEPVSPSADDLLVSYDGQLGTTLTLGDRVYVRRAQNSVLLIRLGGEGYFTRMRTKLNWGDLSEREVVR